MKPGNLRSQCALCGDPTLRRRRRAPALLVTSTEPPAAGTSRGQLVPEDPAGAGSAAIKVFPKEEDAEPLPRSRGADRAGALTVPDPGSDFITFGRESRLVDFSAAWKSRDGTAVLALLPKELFSGRTQSLRNLWSNGNTCRIREGGWVKEMNHQHRVEAFANFC